MLPCVPRNAHAVCAGVSGPEFCEGLAHGGNVRVTCKLALSEHPCLRVCASGHVSLRVHQ